MFCFKLWFVQMYLHTKLSMLFIDRVVQCSAVHYNYYCIEKKSIYACVSALVITIAILCAFCKLGASKLITPYGLHLI